jgi:hypothetical protein
MKITCKHGDHLLMGTEPGMIINSIENKNGYILEFGYYSDPNKADSDGDGHDDGKEVAANTDPNNPFSRPMPNILAPEAGPGAPPAPTT